MTAEEREPMQPHDKQEFAVLIEEMTAMYRRSYTKALAAGYWRLLEAIPMSAIRQACLDLIGDPSRTEGMPPAAEILASARALSASTRTDRYLRCLHVEYGKPPVAADL